jgi:hypothetical protein
VYTYNSGTRWARSVGIQPSIGMIGERVGDSPSP